MEYNHRKKVRHFCHYCMLAGPYKGGGVMASNPPLKYLEKICTAKKLCNVTCERWRPLAHGQKLLNCQEMPPDV